MSDRMASSPDPGDLGALPVVFTGGREFALGPRAALAPRVCAALRAVLAVALDGGRPGVAVAHGANPAVVGGDVLAGLACRDLRREGLPISVRGFPVEPRDGAWPGAGCRRNERMVLAHRPKLAVGFPDPRSSGTWHCLAFAAGLGADLLIDLAALEPASAVAVARAKLLGRGLALGRVPWLDGWLARGPLAERTLALFDGA